MTGYEAIRQRAGALDLHAKDNGRGFSMFCPVHGDTKTRHLYVSQAPDGRVLVHCKHGCGFAEIAEALDLDKRTLGPAPSTTRDGEMILHDYRDEMGHLRYQTCRIGTGKAKKIWHRRPGPLPSTWILNLDGVTKILYRLPEVARSPPGTLIGIGEGEKVAEILAVAGLVGTAHADGSGSWKDEYADPLIGKRVAIFRDYDPDGASWAAKVAASLLRRAIPHKLVDLPGIEERPEHGLDVYDWVKAMGHSPAELAALADSALRGGAETGDGITAADLMAKEFKPIRWAVPGMIGEGLTVFAGGTKAGKSWLALMIGIAIASGGRIFGKIPVEKGEVLYLALEDNQRRLKARLLALLVDEPAPAGLHLFTDWPVLTLGGLEKLDTWLGEHPDCRLAMVDVLQKVRPPRQRGADPYEEDYRVLSAVKALADKHAVSILVLHHTRKLVAPDPFDLVAGTVAVTGVPDGVMVLMRQRDQPDAVLHFIGRDVSGEALALRWDDTAMTWLLMGRAEEHKKSEEREEVAEVLREAGEPLGPMEVAARTGKKLANVKMLLWRMRQGGQIVAVGTGKYTLPREKQKDVLF